MASLSLAAHLRPPAPLPRPGLRGRGCALPSAPGNWCGGVAIAGRAPPPLLPLGCAARRTETVTQNSSFQRKRFKMIMKHYPSE